MNTASGSIKLALQNSLQRHGPQPDPGFSRRSGHCERHGEHAQQREHRRKKAVEVQAHDGPQQPADVVAGRAQHRTQRVAGLPQQPASVHGVVVFQVPNGRLHRLPELEPFALQLGQALELAAVEDLNARVVRVHASESQVHNHLLGPGGRVFGQDRHLLQLLCQRVAVVGVAGEAARPHHQALLVHDRHADLHAELVGFAGLAFADALHFGSVQALTHLAGEVRPQRRLDLRPGHSADQHRERVAQVDHLGQRLAEEVGAVGLGHRQNSQKSDSDLTILRGLGTTR